MCARVYFQNKLKPFAPQEAPTRAPLAKPVLDVEYLPMAGWVRVESKTTANNETIYTWPRAAEAYTAQYGANLPPRELRWSVRDADMYNDRPYTSVDMDKKT
jgi:hypothetical protein